MTNEFNKELIQRLALGDETAHQQIKDLPASTRISLGWAVDEYRKENNVGPMDKGFSLYEDSPSESITDDSLKGAMEKLLAERKSKEEERERLSQEALKRDIEEKTARARAGLPN